MAHHGGILMPYFDKIFAVYKAIDDTRIKGQVVGYFDRERDATENAKGMGWYGQDGIIEVIPTMAINGERYLLISPVPIQSNINFIKEKEQLIKSGIKKIRERLTEAEINALGLNLDALEKSS